MTCTSITMDKEITGLIGCSKIKAKPHGDNLSTVILMQTLKLLRLSLYVLRDNAVGQLATF
jgi:hypothetical protein